MSSTVRLVQSTKIRIMPVTWWAFALLGSAIVGTALMLLLRDGPLPAGGIRQGPIGNVVFIVAAVPVIFIALPVSVVRFMQSVRLLPVLRIRKRPDGYLVSSLFDAPFGAGIFLGHGDKVRVTSRPAPGYVKFRGKPLMYEWRVNSDGRRYTCLSPADLPGAPELTVPKRV